MLFSHCIEFTLVKESDCLSTSSFKLAGLFPGHALVELSSPFVSRPSFLSSLPYV